MGMSASGYLTFGIDLGGWISSRYEHEDEPFGEDGFGEWFYDFEKKETCPVELLFYGDLEYGGEYYVLALKGSSTSSYFEPEAVDPSKLLSVPGWTAAIDFCKNHGLPDFSKAQWLLFANYG